METMADILGAASTDYAPIKPSLRKTGPYDPDEGGPTSGGTAVNQDTTNSTINTTGSFVEVPDDGNVEIEIDKLDEIFMKYSARTPRRMNYPPERDPTSGGIAAHDTGGPTSGGNCRRIQPLFRRATQVH